jgi:membrane-associated protease RseP (regulator of RpoE activity)
VGLLATALNLMPIGQLDGGHILYSFVGGHHRLLTNLFIVALIPLAFFFSWSWMFWALLLFFLGRKHPRIYDPTPLGTGRAQLGMLAFLMFVVSFSPAPVMVD